MPCATEIFATLPEKLEGVRFIFPAAPIELELGGFFDSRAWWPIDMIKLQEMIACGELRDLRNDRPELLETRYQQISELIALALRDVDLQHHRLVVGGFSQGSMLMTEFALRSSDAPAGLIVWSGTLLSEKTWREHASHRGKLSVLQTHGQIDPILPYSGGQLLHQMFSENKFDAEFIPFMGQHTIPREGIDKAAALISDLINRV